MSISGKVDPVVRRITVADVAEALWAGFAGFSGGAALWARLRRALCRGWES